MAAFKKVFISRTKDKYTIFVDLRKQQWQHIFYFSTWDKSWAAKRVISWSSLDWDRGRWNQIDLVAGTAFDLGVHMANWCAANEQSCGLLGFCGAVQKVAFEPISVILKSNFATSLARSIKMAYLFPSQNDLIEHAKNSIFHYISDQRCALAVFSTFYEMKNAITCIFDKVNLTGEGYFNRPSPEIVIFQVRLAWKI